MEGTDVSVGSIPKLWNPDAAGILSLFFTPILGGWLLAKNWRELNQPDKAKKSMAWVYSGIVLAFVVFFLPFERYSSLVSLIFLLSWYFLDVRQQVKYIKENNIIYSKKRWIRPLLIGVCIEAILFAVIWFLPINEPSDKEVIEYGAKSLVTEIIKEHYGGYTVCKSVSIKKKLSDHSYEANAYLSNGKVIDILIEVRGEGENEELVVDLYESPDGLPPGKLTH